MRACGSGSATPRPGGGWRRLAAERGIRLPASYLPADARLTGKWLRRLRVSQADYRAWAGEPAMGTFALRNPGWPLWAWLGLVLEGMADGSLPAVLADGDPQEGVTPPSADGGESGFSCVQSEPTAAEAGGVIGW